MWFRSASWPRVRAARLSSSAVRSVRVGSKSSSLGQPRRLPEEYGRQRRSNCFFEGLSGMCGSKAARLVFFHSRERGKTWFANTWNKAFLWCCHSKTGTSSMSSGLQERLLRRAARVRLKYETNMPNFLLISSSDICSSCFMN